jgi:imidazolonepropionase-like amidohydrolase
VKENLAKICVLACLILCAATIVSAQEAQKSAATSAAMAHAEGTVGIKSVVRAEVYLIEHGTMLDEEVALP